MLRSLKGAYINHYQVIHIVFVLAISFSTSQVMAQDVLDFAVTDSLLAAAQAFDKKGDQVACIAEYDKAIAYTQQFTNSTDKEMADMARYDIVDYLMPLRVQALNRFNQFDAVALALRRGEELCRDYMEVLSPHKDRDIAGTIRWYTAQKGHYHDRRGEYRLAEQNFRSLIPGEWQVKNEEDSSLVGSAFTNLGLISQKNGDFVTAQSHFEQADRFTPTGEKSTSAYAHLRAQRGKLAGLMGQADLANELLNKSRIFFLAGNTAEKEGTAYRKFNNRRNSVTKHYADFLLKQGDPATAERLMRQALDYHTPNDPKLHETYRYLGDIAAAQNRPDDALTYYNQGLTAHNTEYKTRQAARLHLGVARVHRSRQQWSSASVALQRAISELAADEVGSEACDNPDDVISSRHWEVLLEVMTEKTALLHEWARIDDDLLPCAQLAYKFAYKVFCELRAANIAEEARMDFTASNFGLFDVGIALEQRADKVDPAVIFRIIEQSKANSLQSAVNLTRVADYNVSSELLTADREASIKLQTALRDRELPEVGAEKMQQLNEQIRNLHQEKSSIAHELAESHPAYHALRFNHETIPLEEIAEGLADDQVMINYFIGQDNVHALVVRPDAEARHYLIDATPDYLRELVVRFQPTLTDPTLSALDTTKGPATYTNAASAAATYRTVGNELFQMLLAPILDSLASYRRLIIIPDGILNYLPFDALPTDRSDFGDDWTACPFLVKEAAVSYAYSAAMLQLMEAHPPVSQADAEVAIFYHPEFDSQADKITKILTNKGVRAQAVEGRGDRTRFITDVCRSPYAHLATHGVINQDIPILSHFQLGKTTDGVDGEFYFADVFAERMPSDFVFISACDAAQGEWRRGEGILSLTRGFAYAGTKSMISPLWRIMAGSTDQLSIKFYEALAAGYTKDEALAMAKRSLIADPIFAEPYYWAAFLPVGDMQPASFAVAPGCPLLYWVGGLLILVILAFLGKKIIQQR